MKQGIMAVALAMFATFVGAQSKSDPAEEFKKLPWVMAPESGQIAGQATIKLSEQLLFLGEQGSSKFLELTGNPPRSGTYTLVPKDSDWFAVFSFTPDGYVKDDEKIDADALLKSLKESDSPSNEERKRLGMAAIYTDGWHVPPHYDTATKRLEWGVRLRGEDGHAIINYTSRILGREGVMSAVLVSDPKTLDADMVQFRSALAALEYNAGKRYAEFRDGDKVAAYGLGALVLGGAAAAAVKSKGFLKAVLLGVAAFGAMLWGAFKKFVGRGKQQA